MKILFIGPVSPPVSGPSVKNKMLIEWLSANVSSIRLSVLNTYDFRHFKFAEIFSQLAGFLSVKHVFLSVSKNGRFLIIPFCWLFGKKVFLFPAGGSFDDEIRNLPLFFRKMFLLTCKSIIRIYPESHSLASGLEQLNFRNIVYFPNPRINENFLAPVDFTNGSFKIIFLSKLREGKGPLLLIRAVEDFLKKYPTIAVEVNFYGLVDEEFKDKFFNAVERASFAHYRGIAAPEDVQKVIGDHNLFILPSTFPEGVPGAVIEAMFTGIPIVISSFRASSELIEDGVDGLIVPQGDVEALARAIEKVVLNADLRKSMSDAVRISSKRFDMDLLMNDLILDLKRITNGKEK